MCTDCTCSLKAVIRSFNISVPTIVFYYYTLYLKFLNSLATGTSVEEPQIKLSAWKLLMLSSHFAISVLSPKVSHLIRWKSWQKVQGFWLSLTHTVHGILLLASSLSSSSSDPKRSMSSSSLLSVAPLPVMSSTWAGPYLPKAFFTPGGLAFSFSKDSMWLYHCRAWTSRQVVGRRRLQILPILWWSTSLHGAPARQVVSC